MEVDVAMKPYDMAGPEVENASEWSEAKYTTNSCDEEFARLRSDTNGEVGGRENSGVVDEQNSGNPHYETMKESAESMARAPSYVRLVETVCVLPRRSDC